MKKFLLTTICLMFLIATPCVAEDSLEVMKLKIQLWTEKVNHLETQQNWIRESLKELVEKYKKALKEQKKEKTKTSEEAPM